MFLSSISPHAGETIGLQETAQRSQRTPWCVARRRDRWRISPARNLGLLGGCSASKPDLLESTERPGGVKCVLSISVNQYSGSAIALRSLYILDFARLSNLQKKPSSLTFFSERFCTILKSNLTGGALVFRFSMKHPTPFKILGTLRSEAYMCMIFW